MKLIDLAEIRPDAYARVLPLGVHLRNGTIRPVNPNTVLQAVKYFRKRGREFDVSCLAEIVVKFLTEIERDLRSSNLPVERRSGMGKKWSKPHGISIRQWLTFETFLEAVKVGAQKRAMRKFLPNRHSRKLRDGIESGDAASIVKFERMLNENTQ